MPSKHFLRRFGALGVLTVAAVGAGHFVWPQAAIAQPATVPPAAVTAASSVVLPNFTTLVQRYGPSVVNITVTQKREAHFNMPQFGQDDPFFQFFRGMPRQFAQPQNQIVHGLGSGFIVSQDGYILTNRHVVDGATEVTVKLTDRREFKAKVIGVDKKSDIAVIKIDAKNLPVVTIGNADNLQVGEWVLAIGSPFGFDNTVTSGIVSAKARTLPDDSITPFIQTDVPVNPGNSGGPLFNMNGEVVGINSQIFSETGGYEGLSFAIPINIAMHVKDELIAHGKVTRGRIGVSIQEVNQQLANSFGLPRPMGALVSEIASDGTAAKSDLKAGDVITKLNGHDIERSADLPTLVADLKPGTKADLQVWREGKPHDVSVTIGEMDGDPELVAAAGAAGHGRLGVQLRPLQPQERTELGVASGLVVEGVSGPAEAAGLHQGDVILAVNGVPVKTVDQLSGIVGKATTVAVLIARDGHKIFVPIDLS